MSPRPCPHCGHDDFGVMCRYQKLIIDLKLFRGGIKSWVTRYKVERQQCRKCRKGTYPDDYKALPYKYGWGLCCWVTYATIALRQTHDGIAETLDDLFGHSLSHGTLVNLRQQAVDHYRPTYESLLSTLRNGLLIHADETKAKIRGPDKDGYVWVFANATTVVYVYSSTRDGKQGAQDPRRVQRRAGQRFLRGLRQHGLPAAEVLDPSHTRLQR